MAASPKPGFVPTKETYIAGFTLLAILLHILLKYALRLPASTHDIPLFAALLVGGVPMVWELLKKLFKREFGSDLLAGVSILTAIALREYLVATIVVLMLSGGEALEEYATAKASSVLDALARRMPNVAHRKEASGLVDVKLANIRVGDELTVLPHEICPVDGVVLDGHGIMDEAYLTGEPYEISKTPGSLVISGAINGEKVLVIRAERLAEDSRYARIMKVMHETEQQKPQLRRLGDQLGAWYTPIALGVAAAAALITGQAERFLAVVVIATPCPLLLAIPTAIIGAISLAARRAIIIKNPAVLERIEKCRTLIFDKTGTLTYGRPNLTEIICAKDFERGEALRYAASVEQYSKHPLAIAVVTAAKQERIATLPVDKNPRKARRRLERKNRRQADRDHRPAKSDRPHAAAAGISERPGMSDVCRGQICRGVPVPRCATERQRLVHRTPETKTRRAQSNVGFRRSRIGGALPR